MLRRTQGWAGNWVTFPSHLNQHEAACRPVQPGFTGFSPDDAQGQGSTSRAGEAGTEPRLHSLLWAPWLEVRGRAVLGPASSDVPRTGEVSGCSGLLS